MLRPIRTLFGAVAIATSMVPTFASAQEANHAPPPLGCAVENELEIVRTGRVCEVLGATLSRDTVRVRDARDHRNGQAIQILGGDVQWIVALLNDGHVRAWTRVSKTYAQGKEIEAITRAARGLLSQKLAKNERCVRLEPNGGRRMRGFDLAYPWVELKACTRRVTEVVDPWWDEKG